GGRDGTGSQVLSRVRRSARASGASGRRRRLVRFLLLFMTSWGWPALFLLGAYHGINPGMGWLCAVARGMQEHATKAVARALVPITLGHALSIGLVVALPGLIQIVLP